MGALKAWAKRLLGGTPVWNVLLKVRYHLLREWETMVELSRSFRGRLRPAYRRILLRVLPRETACRWVQSQIQNQEFYGDGYFDSVGEPGRESGYAGAYSEIKDFGEVALVARELLGVKSALDVGCAKGFQVRALRRKGIDAWGIDLSEYAVSTAPEEVRPWLRACSIQEADFPAGSFELVLAMELMEHIPLTDIDGVIGKLFFFTSRYVLATIPSFGPNPYGVDGWLEGKVDPRMIPYYRDHLIDLADLRHLVLDSQGLPQHGHVLIASYDWWTAAFTRHGFLRRGDLERGINRRLTSASKGIWCCYLFQKVEPGGEGAQTVSLGGGDFNAREDGWESVAHALSPGLYRLDLELEMSGVDRGQPAAERLLSITCRSGDGERIHGQRLVTKGEFPRKAWSGPVRISLLCAVDGDGTISLRAAPGPGVYLRPVSAIYAPLGRGV